MEIKKEIYQALKKITKIEFDDNTNIDELDIDSLDIVELVTDAEESLGLSISDETLEEIKTVGDIISEFKKATK